jgi:mono/diheme cytochrome c family protein
MGYIVAQRSCASCHEIEKGRFRSDLRPSFATIASRPGTTAMSLEILLTNPHYRMPDYLTRQEIADVSAYITSLK